ncbi:hypothetical protein CCAX7_60060 [Capsulimonas corticalis]|uniref:Anti-sigma factor antagonist n=1 Tax=Capsulimonas corticalis TaxID=2219043 RepID=A0A402D7B9_9BACT|nr:STAS domain-containing protein [Capsulimonas corticalis]BDI30576.1 hypothetical protein CCAX7_26270 [Capsulimonas corticalis]BDI33955.1 hypothetical protein CCAX7_60060 [Capsulimonas corticalis]
MQHINLTQDVLDEGRILKFTIEGDLDLTNAQSIQQSVTQTAASTSAETIIVDIRNVHFIDSAGLAVLLYFHKVTYIDGKMHVIARPKSQPERVLKLDRFNTFMDIRIEE